MNANQVVRMVVVRADDVESVLSEYAPLMHWRGQRDEATEIDRLNAALYQDPDERVEIRDSAIYSSGFEAGVRAERELWTAELQRLIDKYQKIHDEREPEAVAVICGTALGHADELRAALAVVTGKGASDER